jgi:hypothetical protein
MNTLLKSLFVAAALSVVVFSSPSSAQADPYWRNHWGWYDNTYRPYYNNYYGPNYSGAYYGPRYGGYNGYYGNGYYGNGYTSPGPYYTAPGVGVHVGRVNFGWW